MVFLLLFLLVALPVAELTVLVKVAGEIGVLDTIGLLILVSLVGVWLAKRAGLGVVGRIRKAQDAGVPPDREVTDGALILLAGVLLVVPGFITDVVGLALLLPPVRAGVRTLLLRHFRQRGRVVMVDGRTSRSGTSEVWDVESWEEPPRPRGQGQIGGGS